MPFFVRGFIRCLYPLLEVYVCDLYKNKLRLSSKKRISVKRLASRLQVFVHVSTSYCRCEVDVLEERLYPAKHRPEHVMDAVAWMDDELLGHLQPKWGWFHLYFAIIRKGLCLAVDVYWLWWWWWWLGQKTNHNTSFKFKLFLKDELLEHLQRNLGLLHWYLVFISPKTDYNTSYYMW